MAASALLVIVLLGAADPCAAPAVLVAELERAAGESPERFGAAIARVESDLGVSLLRPADSANSGPEQAKLAGARLLAACALKARPVATTGAPDPARLQAILDRSEFNQARHRGGDAFKRWMRRLRQWFDDLFGTRQAESYSEVTRTVVLALALAGVVGAFLRVRLRRRLTRASGTNEPVSPTALKLDSPREHLTRGQVALAGDPREAIREGLLGLLSGLERRRWARPDRVKTNRELAEELPTRGAPAELTARVTELLRWYDRTFYSLEPVPPAEAVRTPNSCR